MFTRILNFDVATHNRQRGTAFFLLCLQGKEKNDRSKEKRILDDDVETISIYKKERIFCRNDSQSLCKFSHHTRPSDIHKSDAAAAGGFFSFPLVQAGILQSSNYLPNLPYLPHPPHPPPSSQRISRRVSEKDPACEQRSVLCVVQAW